MAAPDFTVGDKCLVRHTDHQWWQAEVVRKRVREDGQEELQWKWSGRKTARPNAWKAASDPMIRALPSSTSYMKSWNSKQGHVGRDRWIAASLLAEEGEGDSRRFLVRWRGWSSAYDSWEPAAHIIDAQLIEAFEADKTQQAADAAAARTAAQAAEMEEKRRERAQYARNFIQAVREKTLAELERPALKEKAAAHALFPGENCADWEFKALHEWLQDQVPEGEDVKAHLSDLVQTRGSRGAPTIAFEFSVLSHRLAGLFVDCVDNADGTRWEHVKYKDHGAGMAVCLLPPFTFKRRGPRHEASKINLTISAGVAVLAARNRMTPDWLFDKEVPKEVRQDVHEAAIAGRVVDIHRRKSVQVEAAMLAACKKY